MQGSSPSNETLKRAEVGRPTMYELKDVGINRGRAADLLTAYVIGSTKFSGFIPGETLTMK
jgi:hypothetical protein